MFTYRVVMCKSNLPGDQYLVDKEFGKMSEAIDFVQGNYGEWGLVFTIYDYPIRLEYIPKIIMQRACTYVHMVDSEQINTMREYEYMKEHPIYSEMVRIYDEFKDAMGIQEWQYA